MSEGKTRLPYLEMPKLPQEVLDKWAVSMEAMGKALREFGEAVRAATPSIEKHVAAMARAAQPLAREQADDKSA